MSEKSNKASNVGHRVVRSRGVHVEVDSVQCWVVELTDRASHHRLHQKRGRAGRHRNGQFLGSRVVVVSRLCTAVFLGQGALFNVCLECVLWGVAPPIPPAEWG